MRWLIRLRSTNFLSVPLGLRWAIMAKEFILKDNVVIIPSSCCNASWTSISPLRLVSVGRLCAQTGSSCLGLNLILNSLLMPMSSLCLAKILWYFTLNRSTTAYSSDFNCEFFQLEDPGRLCTVRHPVLDPDCLVHGVAEVHRKSIVQSSWDSWAARTSQALGTIVCPPLKL